MIRQRRDQSCLNDLDRHIADVSGEIREGSFLLQRLLVLIKRFNAVLHNSFVDEVVRETGIGIQAKKISNRSNFCNPSGLHSTEGKRIIMLFLAPVCRGISVALNCGVLIFSVSSVCVYVWLFYRFVPIFSATKLITHCWSSPCLLLASAFLCSRF